ncbi:MAG: DUF1553 domain-containing protein [Planctomycetaceae bacterium]
MAAAVLRSIGLFLLLASSVQAEEPARVQFHFDVKPILSDRCFKCHGPDEESRQGDLRLDRPDGVEHVMTPGDPAQSQLYQRITSNDPDERMPPPDSKLSLTPKEVDVLRQWIEQGAQYTGHWAFEPPGTGDVPNVGGSSWPRNEIDRFVLRRLTEAGLAPAIETSRERLIRRVTFDLTGLPPTLEEIDAFLADTSADAYERVVDRLFASEHYGERMASEWLDVARYSDSYGYQVDRDRFIWPWRDWVVRAFNRNLPYDQFITEQLAGDLLPNATDDQILATAFNRLHSQEAEGGSVPEEYRCAYVADRTETVVTAFLGLTLECARCHDHKFDPISQKEYYQFAAFLNNIDEFGLYSYFTDAVPTPTLALTDAATKDKLARVRQDVVEAEQRLQEISGEQTPHLDAWLNQFRISYGIPVGAIGGDASTAALTNAPIPGRIAHLDFEGEIAAPNSSVEGRVGQAVQLTGDDAVPLEVGNFDRFDPFSIALWMNTPDHKERAVILHRSRAWTDAGSRGYELLIEDGRLSAALIHFWPGNAIRIRTVESIPVEEWLHVGMTYDGSGRADGLRIYVNGAAADIEVVRDKLTKTIAGGGGDHITIGERFRDSGFAGGRVDEFQVFDRELTPVEVAQLHDGHALSDLLRKPVPDLSASDRRQLADYFLSTSSADYQGQRTTLRIHREVRARLQDGLQEIMVMREFEGRKPTYVLRRGEYNQPGEAVSPGTPSVFPPLPAYAPRNRLGLACWLTSEDHPLTARVAVNRYWQMIFGEGLVRTPEDFGNQGELPTHPELLDWLARDVIEHGWDVKRLLRQMVTSSTYRQSSSASSEALKADPENRLWSRKATYRLPAEMLRDNALAVSGLLVDRLGGPPAKPYEVEVSFSPVTADTGEGLYRRSLYTYWKRSGPAPVLMTLDASKRDVCQVRRAQTSSPLQAFVMMNSPQFVEAARVLSERLLQVHGGDTPAILDEMFRLLTSRRATDQERAVLNELYELQRDRFAGQSEPAAALVAIGAKPRDESLDVARLAALTVVANTMFNFDECVTHR